MVAKTTQHLQPSAPAQQLAPDSSCIIRLEVTQLRPYDRNPRRCPNSEYQRIKASIRAEGLDQPLVVTHRPGDIGYMLLAGGNTRLRAMQALFHETSDERFRFLDCHFKPWVAESDVLLSHLRENELRENLFFIDKALAVFEAKALFEAESKGRPLSQRRLAELITLRGLSFSQTLISRMAYAVQTLLPLIPQALAAGMGTPQVARIQGLERAARAIWAKKSLGDEEEFDLIFATLCRRYDSPDWVTDVLRGALETELAGAAEEDLALIRMELDALIAGKSFRVIGLDSEKPDGSRALASNAAAKEDQPSAVDMHANDTSMELERPSAAVTSKAEKAANSPRPATREKTSLDHLRQRAFELATRIAHAHGLGNLIEASPDQGLGYVVQDVPDAVLTDVLDEDLKHLITGVWWQLAACAETAVAPPALMAAQLKEGSAFRDAIAGGNKDWLFAAIAPLDPSFIGANLWRWLSDEDWQSLVALAETYRGLHRWARESGQPLWQEIGEEDGK
jgi:ParB family protein of integrating conjugative element (PFGI_1 class)